MNFESMGKGIELYDQVVKVKGEIEKINEFLTSLNNELIVSVYDGDYLANSLTVRSTDKEFKTLIVITIKNELEKRYDLLKKELEEL
jgi:hypothetical protein